MLTLNPAWAAEQPAQRGEFQQHLRPLLEKHCFKCHDEKKQKGGIDLTDRKSVV